MKTKLLVFFIFLSCQLSSKSMNEVDLPDSLVTIENVYVYCLTEPDKAQQIIDRLRELNDDKLAFDYEMDWAQGDLYFNTGKYRLASYYFERVLNYEEVKTNRKFLMGLLSTMLECYQNNNNIDKTMDTAIKLLEITEADGIKEETGRAYQYMAEVFSSRKDSIQTKKYFDMAEQQLKESRHIPYLYHFYITFANLLAKNKQYRQALKIISKAEKVLDLVANDPNMMPEGYDGFEKSRFKAFAAEILAKNGKQEEAERYYKEFISEPLSKLPENNVLIVPYLLTTKKYDEAVAISLERENYLRNNTDTIGDNMLAVKSYLAKAYEGLGMEDHVIETLNQQLSIKEQLIARQLNSASQELAVIYETEKKDAEIKRIEADAKLHHSLVFALSVISFLTLVIMIIIVCRQKKTKKHNQLMVQQIKEIQMLKDSQGKGYKNNNALEESSLYIQLEKLMKHDKLYQNPTCNREIIMGELGIDKNALLELQHTNDIHNLPDYINGFRLEETISLLEKDTSLSIEEIAKQAGFGSSRSLQRQFKDKYNMSPAKYRKLAGKNDKNAP